jgi:cobalt-zinc-cadmium efflux system membrane fusion protein
MASAHIETAEVVRAEVNNEVVANGKVSFDALRVAHVFSPVTGRVDEINAELGARVKKGDPLAVIDSPDLGMANADVNKARADLVAAEHEWTRQKELLAAHASAQREMEAAADNYYKARAEVERAEQKARLLVGAATQKKQGVSQSYILRSPIDGEIIARNVNPGIEVLGQYAGGTAAELFTVGEWDKVWVLADIFEMDVGRIQVGNAVKVKAVSYPDTKFEGQVDWLSATIDPQTHTAKVRCTLANPKHLLKPEMFATVIIAASGPKKVVVPRHAVLRLGEQTLVFLLAGTDGDKLRFVRRAVVVDDEGAGDLVPVLHGLEVGSQVVSTGTILLSAME